MLTLIIFLACTIQLQDSKGSINDEKTKSDSPNLFSESGWTAFGGSAAHTGYKSDYIGPIEGLGIKWSVNVTEVLSFPAVHDNKVFATTNDGVLHVFDELTGIELGSVKLGDGYYVGPPTIGNDGEEDLVFVQFIFSTSNTTVYAVRIRNLLNMHVKWSASGSAEKSMYQHGVAISHYSGLVYYPGGTYNDVTMYGVNYTTGETKFASKIITTEDCGANWAPTVDEQGRVFFSVSPGWGYSGYIGEADPFSGDVIWKYYLNSIAPNCSTDWVPVVYDNIAVAVVYSSWVQIQASLLAVHVTTQTMLWTTDVFPIVINTDTTPAVDGSHVFFTSADGIRSFNLQTGTLATKYVPCDGCFGQPVVTENYLFAQSSSGTVVFDKMTGDLLAETQDGSGKMAYNAGSVYVSVKSTLIAYEVFF